MKAYLVSITVLLFVVSDVQAFPGGAPVDACGSLTPNHPDPAGPIDPANNPPEVFIYSKLFDNDNGGNYEAGQTYSIILATISNSFRGLLIQAQTPGGSLIGSFTIYDSDNSQLLTCSGDPDSTVTHTNNNLKTRISFEWTAPDSSGTVEMRYSIVTAVREDYYADLNAAGYRPPCPFPPTLIGYHPTTIGLPDGCSRESCDYYVGFGPNTVNSDYLDIYLEGEADGWIALGFSENTQMEEDDVLGCRIDSDVVNVVDTWNPTNINGPNGRTPNVADDTQNGVCPHLTSVSNGRISCSFSRSINITDVGQDYNLNNSFYLFFGLRAEAQPNGDNLGYHTMNGGMTPIVSDELYNPVTDFDEDDIEECPPAPGDNANYTFQFGSPGDDYYLAARINPENDNYLDVLLEGDTNGWVAVGFSNDRTMNSDDVLGCKRDPNDDSVAVIDTYNPSTQYDPNQVDPTQEGVCTHSTDFNNGRITCSFSRLIEAIDSSDRTLSDDLYLFFGTSETGGSAITNLLQHDNVPDISEQRVDITTDSSVAVSDFPRTELLKVHGIIMVLSWPLLVVIAIFFAAWMKPAMPNGQWFQFHRIFMVVSLFLTAIGFIFAFVANAENPSGKAPGLISFACGTNITHYVFGIIVFFLQIINPIIAIFRCKPNEANRWIFNLFHGTVIGFLAELLALTNVGIGIALFESGGCIEIAASEYTILWVYIAFVCFLLITQFVLFVIFTISAFTADPAKRAKLAPSFIKYFFVFCADKPTNTFEMANPGKDKDKSNDPPPKKTPSKDAPLRWGAFGIFIPVTVIMMIVVMILIAIE